MQQVLSKCQHLDLRTLDTTPGESTYLAGLKPKAGSLVPRKKKILDLEI